MAINKNFVIKNGVQVSTDLIIGDADNNKVGIGTTIPHYGLHVGVARGGRGGIGATDLVVSGVATINQLSVTGVSTFAGALDVNSTVDFAGDVVFNGTNDITYDQSESALVFNDNAAIRVGTGSDFSIMHDGSNTILRERGTGGLKILGSQIELLGSTAGETLAKFTEDGGIELYDDNTKRIETTGLGATVFGDLTISGVTTSARLLVTGISTFTGLVDANGGAHIDNLRLGIDADNDITTSSGNLTLDSQGGTVQVNDNLTVDGLLDANGGASIDNIQIGVTGDNEIDTSTLNLILDSAGGTINIDDGITVSGFSTFTGISSFNNDLNVGITTFFVDKSTGRIGIGTNVPTAALEIGKTTGTGIGVSIFENGNAAFSGIVTVGGNLNVTGDIVYDEVNGRNLNITGVATVADLGVTGLSTAENFRVGYGATIHEHGGAAFAGITTINGNLLVGGDILPNADGAKDLGAVGAEFQDLFIDGTANIDSLSADTAVIGDLTDNRVVIAGSSGELEDDGNLTFDGTGLRVGTAATIQVGGAAAFAGIVTANGGLVVGANGTLGSTAIGATITTNGNAAFVGIVTAASFVGALTGNVTGDVTGNATTADGVDVGAVSTSSDLRILFTSNGDGAGRTISCSSGSDDFTYNPNTKALVVEGAITADSFSGTASTIASNGNAAFVGVVTAGRGFNLGIASAGLTVARNVGISTLNFIGTGNSITYHATHNQLDISIGGSGGGGGVSETSTSVSSTSATACGSFDKTEKRSSAVLAQITQGSAYQIGRYLLIHDGTTVTTIEESAIATGSMLGTFEGVINGDDVEFRVTMSSSSSATVITKIDSISV